MIHFSRFPAIAFPMLERTFGSAIQQSRMLIPCSSQQSITAFTSSVLWRSSHSPPRPISLTFSPVLPSSLYFIAKTSSFFFCQGLMTLLLYHLLPVNARLFLRLSSFTGHFTSSVPL